MRSIQAISLTPAVIDWLANTRHPRILHVFNRASNLINESGEILSVVTPEIGNGPFNLVLEKSIQFTEHMDAQTTITISQDQILLGNLIIDLKDADPWEPHPNWKNLYANKEAILNRLNTFPIADYMKPIGLPLQGLRDTDFAASQSRSIEEIGKALSFSLVIADLPSSIIAAKQLSGLGIGLTPSGDDFIMGGLHAARIIHPPEIAEALAGEIANIVTSLTTSLSAAWLRSAGRGEAGSLWHEFFDALITGSDIHLQISKLLSVGASSGADALTGFMGVINAYRERMVG